MEKFGNSVTFGLELMLRKECWTESKDSPSGLQGCKLLRTAVRRVNNPVNCRESRSGEDNLRVNGEWRVRMEKLRG